MIDYKLVNSIMGTNKKLI